MKRYSFESKSPHYIDATDAQSALQTALKEKLLVIHEREIPRPAVLECHVSPTANPGGQFSAFAQLRLANGDIEVIATADAPTPERALRALGYQNPDAHTCRIYRQRFGDLYELTLAKKS